MSECISLAICTFNRHAQLRLTLQSLVAVKSEFRPDDEVLIIDNNSTDETAQVVERFECELPIRRVLETQQGLACARNRALDEYQHSGLVFIDDDVTVREGFLSAYRRVFAEKTDVGFFGGRIWVEWGNHKPGWYVDDSLPLINGFLVHYDLGEKPHRFSSQSRLPYGANFGLRRSLIERVGIFNPNLGVKGVEIGRGEESDYFKRALQLELVGEYLPSALVGHRFQKERMALRYLLTYGRAKARAELFEGRCLPNKISAFKEIVWQCLAGLKQLAIGRRDRAYQCVINIGINLEFFLLAHGIGKLGEHG